MRRPENGNCDATGEVEIKLFKCSCPIGRVVDITFSNITLKKPRILYDDMIFLYSSHSGDIS